jgi:hypothetical protein
MNRALVAVLAALILIPAALALLSRSPRLAAQEDPKAEEKLDALIRSLTDALAQREAAIARPVLTFEQHLYDVRDLVVRVEDYPARLRRLVPSGGFGFGFEEEPSEPATFFEVDTLVELIRETVAPASWDELSSTSIGATPAGCIVVRHTPAVHERIAALLGELRKTTGKRVAVDLLLVDCADADLRESAGTGFILDEAAEKKLLAAAKVLRSASVTATNLQVVGLVDATSVSYVQDYDVEVAERSTLADPIVQTFSDGLVAQVSPVVTGAGDLVVLELRVLLQVARRPIAIVETPIGAIETPCLETLDLRTTLALPAGRWAVAGGATTDGDGHGWLLLARATPSQPAGR